MPRATTTGCRSDTGALCTGFFAVSVAGGDAVGLRHLVPGGEACGNSPAVADQRRVAEGGDQHAGPRIGQRVDRLQHGEHVRGGEHRLAPSACVSSAGAFDMVGNLGEWVAGLGGLDGRVPGWGGLSNDAMCAWTGERRGGGPWRAGPRRRLRPDICRASGGGGPSPTGAFVASLRRFSLRAVVPAPAADPRHRRHDRRAATSAMGGGPAGQPAARAGGWRDQVSPATACTELPSSGWTSSVSPLLYRRSPQGRVPGTDWQALRAPSRYGST